MIKYEYSLTGQYDLYDGTDYTKTILFDSYNNKMVVFGILEFDFKYLSDEYRELIDDVAHIAQTALSHTGAVNMYKELSGNIVDITDRISALEEEKHELFDLISKVETMELAISNITGKLPDDIISDISIEDNILKISYNSDKDVLEYNLVDSLSGYLLTEEDKTAISEVREILQENKIDHTYNSQLDENLTVYDNVGGFVKGTELSDLKGKSISDMFDMLLFPLINPTFKEPSLKINNSYNIAIVGTPVPEDFEYSFDKGEILINGEKQADRAGEISDVEFSSENETGFIELGDNVFFAVGIYSQGEQPKNSHGEDFGEPLESDTIQSDNFIINGTLPYYATTESSELTEMPLIVWSDKMKAGIVDDEEIGITLIPHSKNAVQKFSIPRELKAMKQFNELSGKFETVSFEDWTVETTQKTFGADEYEYFDYTYTGPYRDSVKIILGF